jgi:hypothetical protein
MELLKMSDFIQNIYTTINIYHSILLYDTDDEEVAKQLCDILICKDMPLFFLNSNHNMIDNNILHFIENNYRMIAMPISIFKIILKLKNNDISNVSVIFALGKNTIKDTQKYIVNNNVNYYNQMHLFSL